MIDNVFEDEALQKRIDEIAKKSGLTSVLVMKSHPNEMEVVLSGGDKGKEIYHAKDRGKKSVHPQGEHPLYCEKVVNSNAMLEVQDAASDKEWMHNEDLTEFGLGSYIGLPIEQNGKVVGTVCALNNTPMDFRNDEYHVLNELTALKAEIESKE